MKSALFLTMCIKNAARFPGALLLAGYRIHLFPLIPPVDQYVPSEKLSSSQYLQKQKENNIPSNCRFYVSAIAGIVLKSQDVYFFSVQFFERY